MMRRYLQKSDALGLLLLVAAAIRYSVTNVWDRLDLGLAVAGVVLVVMGIAANYREILATLGRRSTKYAANYVVSIILVVAVVSGLNYLGQRHSKRFDMTEAGSYTLAPQTVQVLDKLAEDVDVKAFFPGGEYVPLKELLVEYRTESRRVKYEFIDPDKRPDVAKQFDVSVYGTFQNPFTGSQLKFGTVVVTYGERREKIEKRSEEVGEEDLTNAIIKASRSETKKVYFIQGHSEKDPANTERLGYSNAKKALEDQGYTVATVNLASEGKVPPDAKVLVEAGPTTEPFPQELQFVDDFLNRGGGVMVLVDPSPAPSLGSFLKSWGVQVDDNLVLDVSGAGRLMGTGPSIPLVLSYESHDITDRFKAMTFFPMTRSIRPLTDVPDGLKVQTLFRSNPDSWGETDINSKEASFDENADTSGPLSLAVAVTKEVKAASDNNSAINARLVVVGDSNFPINSYFQAQGNGNMFLNMISWLAQDEDLISIRPKSPEDRRIILSQSQLAMLRLITVFVLPGVVLVAGTIVWTRRRR